MIKGVIIQYYHLII